MFASCVVWRLEGENVCIVYKNTIIPFLSVATDPSPMLRYMNTGYPLVTFRDMNAFFCSTLTSYSGDLGFRSRTEDLPFRGRGLGGFMISSV